MGRAHNKAIEEVRKLIDLLPGGRANVLSQSGRLYGSPGIADVYCTIKGLAFWVEVKTGKDVMSEAQLEFKARSDPTGVPVVVGRAEDVIDWLKSKGVIG